MLFSIIVPVYNVEKYLGRCVDSILAQNYTAYELFLIDDGSPDGCPAICDAYAKKDARVRVLHKQNSGLVSARNAGLRMAAGEYILYVDGDDWVEPNWLGTVRQCILTSPEKPDMVVFGAEKHYPGRTETCLLNTPGGRYDRKALEEQIFPSLLIDRRLAYGESILYPASWNRAFQHELLKVHHCKDEKIRIGEDNAYVFECTLESHSLVVCKDVLLHYNKDNAESILGKPDHLRFQKRLRLFRYLKKHLSVYGPVITSQFDDYFASRILLDIADASRNIPKFSDAVRHISKELQRTRILRTVHISKLAGKSRWMIFLLKIRFYRLAVLIIRIYEYLKNAARSCS